jgi:hypothetical protein
MAVKTKGIPPIMGGMPFFLDDKKLDYRYVCRGRTFLTLLDIKCNLVAFIQRFETARIDGGMMYKNIWSVFLLNEAKSFTIIKPFNSSIGHDNNLLSSKLSTSPTGGCQDGK